MALVLRCFIILACLCFFIFIFSMVRKERFLLKYTLVWLFAALIALIVAVDPQIAYVAARTLGFETPSNFVFFLALIFLIAICLSLSAIVSKQTLRIKELVQKIALLEKRMDEPKSKVGGKDDS